jgi:hypothetical protein
MFFVMLNWFIKLFKRSPLNNFEPVVEVISSQVQEPCVRIAVGKKSMLLSSAQARRLWGKLGAALEKMTPDD